MHGRVLGGQLDGPVALNCIDLIAGVVGTVVHSEKIRIRTFGYARCERHVMRGLVAVGARSTDVVRDRRTAALLPTLPGSLGARVGLVRRAGLDPIENFIEEAMQLVPTRFDLCRLRGSTHEAGRVRRVYAAVRSKIGANRIRFGCANAVLWWNRWVCD